LLREAFDGTTLDDKELNPKIAKMGEMKKAMPFIQGLKKRLMSGEKPQTVFDRELAFDEIDTLKEMAAGLQRTTGCKAIEIVAVDEGGKAGISVIAGVEGKRREGLPPTAEAAVPGTPTFHFENVEV